MTLDVEQISERAVELIALADGFEASNETIARRMRVVARDVIELVEAYTAEQSGRVAAQTNYERAMAVMRSRLYSRAIEHGPIDVDLGPDDALASRAAPAVDGDEPNPFL